MGSCQGTPGPPVIGRYAPLGFQKSLTPRNRVYKKSHPCAESACVEKTRCIRCRQSPSPTVNIDNMPACQSRARPSLGGSSRWPAPAGTRTRTHTHTHTYTRTHAHAHAHTHMHTRMHTHMVAALATSTLAMFVCHSGSHSQCLSALAACPGRPSKTLLEIGSSVPARTRRKHNCAVRNSEVTNDPYSHK